MISREKSIPKQKEKKNRETDLDGWLEEWLVNRTRDVGEVVGTDLRQNLKQAEMGSF